MTYTTSGNPHHVGFPVHGRGFSHETCVTVSETGYLSFESRAPTNSMEVPDRFWSGRVPVSESNNILLGPTGVL